MKPWQKRRRTKQERETRNMRYTYGLRVQESIRIRSVSLRWTKWHIISRSGKTSGFTRTWLIKTHEPTYKESLADNTLSSMHSSQSLALGLIIEFRSSSDQVADPRIPKLRASPECNLLTCIYQLGMLVCNYTVHFWLHIINSLEPNQLMTLLLSSTYQGANTLHWQFSY